MSINDVLSPDELPEKIAKKKVRDKYGQLIDISSTYVYREEKGGIFCYKCRFDWPDPDKEKGRDKTFRSYYIADGVVKTGFPRGGYYPLFKADKIADAKNDCTIVIVEGEKAATCKLAVETEKDGFIFTCSLAEKKTNFSSLKRFRDIIIIPDNDETGIKKAIEIKAYVPQAKIIEPYYELPESGDIADLENWTAESLVTYIETAGEYDIDNGHEKRIAETIKSAEGYSFDFEVPELMRLALSEEAYQFTLLKEHKQAADLVTKAFYGNVIYCDAEKKFFYFNGNVWKELINIIDSVLAVLYKVAKISFKEHDSSELMAVMKDVSKKAYPVSVIEMLKQKPELYMKQVPWNHHQAGTWILNDEIITLDENGQIVGRPGKRDEFFNNPLPYTKDEIVSAAQPKKFLSDLETYFPDIETRSTAEYLLAAIFSGDIGFKKIPIMVGLSDTGKSTLLKALGQGVFPGLFSSIPAEVVCPASKKYDNGEAPSPQLVKLIDHRVLGVFEIEQGRRAATGLLKTVSGGDPLTARRLRENPISFNPSAYIVLCTNYLPSFTGGDAAFCNRLIILPFTNVIPPEKQKTQEQIISEFKGEAAGILKHLIRKYKELVMDHGRIIPESEQCRRRKRKYIKENDNIGLFIKTCLEIDLDHDDTWEKLDTVANAYREFFELTEKDARNSKISRTLINRMEEIESDRKKIDGKLVGILRNVRLKPEAEWTRKDPELFTDQNEAPTTDVFEEYKDEIPF